MNIHHENYERFFEVSGASYLFASIFFESYKPMGALIMNDNDVVSVYLNKPASWLTRQDGLQLFSNKSQTESYINEFETFLERTEPLLTNLSSTQIINVDNVEMFFSKIQEFFGFYRKTEFFYTDLAFQQAHQHPNTNSILEQNLKSIEGIKFKGRSFLNSIFNGSQSFLQRELTNLSRFTMVDVSGLELHDYKELLRISELPLPHLVLNERKKNYFLVSSNQQQFLSGEAFNNAKQNFISENTLSPNTVKGTVANAGYVSGIARVLVPNFHNFDELAQMLDNMVEGEILVTESTSPDLIVACQKASAIVTNQGGLGSHAATISRELGIPCVVGTQNATKVIKTGDKILVDANNGVIYLTLWLYGTIW